MKLGLFVSMMLALGAAMSACAEGTDEGLGVGEADVNKGTRDGGSSTLPGDDDDDDDVVGDDDDDDAGDVDAGGKTDAGKTDAGKDDAGATDAGSSDGGGASGGGCAAPTACASGKLLAEMTGDLGTDTRTASGTTSTWITVPVVEGDTGPFAITGRSMRVRATLTSPTGVDFDLYAYISSDLSKRECSLVAQSSRRTTATDTVNLEWGESNGGLSNGSRDDANVTFEVRRVSGTCDASTTWTLNIEGNTP